MPWVEFTADFNWHIPEHGGRATIAYKRGMCLMVRTPCAKAALAAGKAVRARKPQGYAIKEIVIADRQTIEEASHGDPGAQPRAAEAQAGGAAEAGARRDPQGAGEGRRGDQDDGA